MLRPLITLTGLLLTSSATAEALNSVHFSGFGTLGQPTAPMKKRITSAPMNSRKAWAAHIARITGWTPYSAYRPMAACQKP